MQTSDKWRVWTCDQCNSDEFLDYRWTDNNGGYAFTSCMNPDCAPRDRDGNVKMYNGKPSGKFQKRDESANWKYGVIQEYREWSKQHWKENQDKLRPEGSTTLPQKRPAQHPQPYRPRADAGAFDLPPERSVSTAPTYTNNAVLCKDVENLRQEVKTLREQVAGFGAVNEELRIKLKQLECRVDELEPVPPHEV